MISIKLSILIAPASLPVRRGRGGESGKLCKANSILSAVYHTMGKVSFVALTALVGGWEVAEEKNNV